MARLGDFINAIEDLIPGDHPVTDRQLDRMKNRAVDKALGVHSRHRPRRIVEDVCGGRLL